MKVKKNYGIMKYTKAHKNPGAQASAKYLAEMFDLKTLDRVIPIAQRVRKELKVPNCASVWEVDHHIIRAIFLEKQLLAHGRNRMKDEFNLDDYNTDNTLESIARDYYTKVKARQQAKQSAYDAYNQSGGDEELRKKYNEICDKCNEEESQEVDLHKRYKKILSSDDNVMPKPETPKKQEIHPALKSQEKKKTTEEIKKQCEQVMSQAMQSMHATNSEEQRIVDWIKDYAQNSYSAGAMYREILKNQNNGKTEFLPGESGYRGVSTESAIKKYITQTGEYKDIPLQKTLKKILDDILGNAEIRSVERGFNRPSRFSHFVKGCFLPVYRCNKPRKRPAFYIDASGSMEDKRGEFNCVTSAIGAFLYSQHRRISELRPKYYAFRSGLAEKLELSKYLPRANGGTSVKFLAAINPQENSIVITDADFTPHDLAVVRMWAIDNPNAQVHWIVNNRSTSKYLNIALSGLGKHKVHFTQF